MAPTVAEALGTLYAQINDDTFLGTHCPPGQDLTYLCFLSATMWLPGCDLRAVESTDDVAAMLRYIGKQIDENIAQEG